MLILKPLITFSLSYQNIKASAANIDSILKPKRLFSLPKMAQTMYLITTNVFERKTKTFYCLIEASKTVAVLYAVKNLSNYEIRIRICQRSAPFYVRDSARISYKAMHQPVAIHQHFSSRLTLHKSR